MTGQRQQRASQMLVREMRFNAANIECRRKILDFITTVGRDHSDLINFPNLNVAMVPLQFMEFSLKDIRQAALISEEGAILVNVPNPARYALHKLIVAEERDGI
jgi:hypothetical protein